MGAEAQNYLAVSFASIYLQTILIHLQWFYNILKPYKTIYTCFKHRWMIIIIFTTCFFKHKHMISTPVDPKPPCWHLDVFDEFVRWVRWSRTDAADHRGASTDLRDGGSQAAPRAGSGLIFHGKRGGWGLWFTVKKKMAWKAGGSNYMDILVVQFL